MCADILIVDDEDDIRRLIKGILEDEGYLTREAANSKQAYDQIAQKIPDLIIQDIWLQNSEHDGLEILKSVKEKHEHIPFLMISGHGTIETAVSSIKDGAYDFIEKPFKSDRLLLMINRALESARLKQENEALRQKIEDASELTGNSAAIQAVKQALSRVAPTNSRILLMGEAGTGKDVAARFIHKLSERYENPFLIINCANLHPGHFETELFGDAGAQGLFEKAQGGTLFLDEVADMPLETQGKIVRVLQEQKFQKPGDKGTIEIDVRIIASTNKDLKSLIDQGKFREDLYYRLNVVPIIMPSLSERQQDIPALTEYFINLFTKQTGLQKKKLSESSMAIMQAHAWPGNIRQLRNVIEWLMIMGPKDHDIGPDNLPPEINSIGQGAEEPKLHKDLVALSLREAREMFEREYLLSQINRFGGNVSKTAQFVGMERSALHRKLKSLDISSSSKQDENEEDIHPSQQRA